MLEKCAKFLFKGFKELKGQTHTLGDISGEYEYRQGTKGECTPAVR